MVLHSDEIPGREVTAAVRDLESDLDSAMVSFN